MYLAKGISWTRFHKVLKISLCYDEFAWFYDRHLRMFGLSRQFVTMNLFLKFEKCSHSIM